METRDLNWGGQQLGDDEVCRRLAARHAHAERVDSLRMPACNLTRCPPLEGFHQLVLLSLATNGLSELPPSLGALSSLKWLDVSWNQLTDSCVVPIGELPSLRTLNLAGNRLTRFSRPNRTLVTLHLASNALERVPDFAACSKLSTLSLRNNPGIPQRFQRSIVPPARANGDPLLQEMITHVRLHQRALCLLFCWKLSDTLSVLPRDVIKLIAKKIVVHSQRS